MDKHTDLPFIEIRRAPKSTYERQENGLFDPFSAHVRLCNRTCYYDGAATIMQHFLEEHHFAFQRISRIDICLDFELFDTRDNPQVFLQRYFAGRYAKINQGNVASRARDQWDARKWNSVSWGSKSSMITTKLYNKTLELKEVKDKPYIRQAWLSAGLVDDVQELWKIGEDSTKHQPDIWRLEFSIKSGTRKWFIIEDYNGTRKQIRSVHHTLADYQSRQMLLDRFFSLVDHYFHFKHVEFQQSRGITTAALSALVATPTSRQHKRKDRCSDKILFYPTEQSAFYKMENPHTDQPRDHQIDVLLARLQVYRDTHAYRPEVYRACNVIIEQLETERRTNDLTHPWTMEQLTAIRMIIAHNIKHHGDHTDTTATQLESLLRQQPSLFGEVDEHNQKREPVA